MKSNNGTVSRGLTAGFATPVEAADFLRLSKAMIHKLIAKGEIPASRFGKAVRIPWPWLQSQVDPKSLTGA